jgi:NADH:ubiquinone oxidoreductase subunit K
MAKLSELLLQIKVAAAEVASTVAFLVFVYLAVKREIKNLFREQ